MTPEREADLVEAVERAIAEAWLGGPKNVDAEFMRAAILKDTAKTAINTLRTMGALDEGWEPIESAPKDGTEILGIFVGTIDTDYSLVRWDCRRWIAQADGQRAIESQGDTWTDLIEPFLTHWMPLPPPPKGPEKEAEPTSKPE